jgi:Lon protease-like protein
MIGRCIQEKSPFGVCLIKAGSEVGGAATEPFRVGTTAHITGVQELDEGRMNITCTGGNRFSIREITQQTPYLVAEVEVLGAIPETGERVDEVVHTASALFAEYVRLNLAVANQWSRTIELPSQPAALSDYIAARLGIDLWARQRLLEEPSPTLRLQVEIELIAGLIRDLNVRVQAARSTRWLGFGVLN